jgi:hypothetical protein
LTPQEIPVHWVAIAIQMIGLVSVVAARMWPQSPGQTWCQCFFFLSLAGVGGATMFALASGSGSWVSSAAILSLMSVGATLDLRRTSEVAAI